ncbi:MAG: hypothetical protein KF745_01300 [Phycisphaeraceae bacterium]|nr:hypothetical protein [Phycisphaeraceae bacterium]
MARKKKSRTQASTSPGPLSRWFSSLFSDWSRTTRSFTTIATAVIVVGLIAGLAVGRSPLKAKAEEIRSDRLTVVFNWPPAISADPRAASSSTTPNTWVDSETRTRLEQLALSCLTANTFDGESLQRAQSALQATGWFANEVRVRRDKAGVVRVDGQWRVPFACVRTNRGDQWVTFRGEALDKIFAPDTSGLCVVHGVRTPPPSLGSVWEGGEVQPSLALLQYIRPCPGFEQVVGIDASDYLSKNRRLLSILTRHNTRILWGGPVDQPLPGEMPSGVKLKNLSDIVMRTGRVDAGRPFIDIRGRDILVETGVEPAHTQGR